MTHAEPVMKLRVRHLWAYELVSYVIVAGVYWGVITLEQGVAAVDWATRVIRVEYQVEGGCGRWHRVPPEHVLRRLD